MMNILKRENNSDIWHLRLNASYTEPLINSLHTSSHSQYYWRTYLLQTKIQYIFVLNRSCRQSKNKRRDAFERFRGNHYSRIPLGNCSCLSLVRNSILCDRLLAENIFLTSISRYLRRTNRGPRKLPRRPHIASGDTFGVRTVCVFVVHYR